MFIKTKAVFVLLILMALLAIAAQCGARPEPQQVVPSAQEVEAMAQAQDNQENKEEEEHKEDEDEHNRETVLEALAPVSLGAGEKLKVIATTTIIGDLARNVASDLVDVTILMPIGSDPHTFNPTPGDVAVVADAHVVFINGLNLEESLIELIKNAGGQAAMIPVSAGVEPRELGEGEAHEHQEDEEDQENGEAKEEQEHEEDDHEEAEAGHAHAHEGIDPHIWTTPTNAIVMVHNIETTLRVLDPANAARYEANAAAYTAQLEELDAWIKAQVGTVPSENRKLVTDHETFGYYADRYGFEVIGTVIPGSSTNTEPSAQELAELQEVVSNYGVKAVFVGTTVSPVLAERLAEDTGIRLVPLYSDSLGGAGSGAETYLDYLQFNTRAIVEALK